MQEKTVHAICNSCYVDHGFVEVLCFTEDVVEIQGSDPVSDGQSIVTTVNLAEGQARDPVLGKMIVFVFVF